MERIRYIQDSYSYILRYDAVIQLLNNIEPYLVVQSKKNRAQLIIHEYKKLTPRNGKYTKELFEKKALFYERFIAL